MNQEHLSDIEKEILFLINNPENLDHLIPSDLTLFKEALKLIKEQVIQQIILDAVTFDPSLPEQMAATKKILDLRIEKLQQKKDAMSQSLKSSKLKSAEKSPEPITSTKEEPLDEQIVLLQAGIDSIDSLSKSLLDNPQEFVENFCAKRICYTQNSGEYNSLVKDCALSMALLNSSPGKNFSGLTDKEKAENGPLFNTEKSTHGFPIYILNPVSLSTFFKRIKNPKLINELDLYYTQIAPISSLKSHYETQSSNLEDTTNKLNAITTPEIYQELDNYLTSMYQAIDDYFSTKSSLNETTHKQPKPKTQNLFVRFFNKLVKPLKVPNNASNPFVNFFRKLFRNKTNQNAPLPDTISEKLNDLKKSQLLHDKLTHIKSLKSEHEERLGTDPNYELAYKTYLEHSLSSNYLTQIPKINLSNENDKFYVLNKIHFFNSDNKINFAKLLEVFNREGLNFRNDIIGRLDQSKSKQQSVVDSLSQQLAQQESQPLPDSGLTKQELYNQLSPEAQYLVDANINVAELKSRYIDFTAQPNYIYSPFAASLVVKALLKAFDIRSTKEAEELGLTFTQDEAIERQRSITSTLAAFKAHLKSLSDYGKELEER